MPDAKTKKVVELIIAATNDKISESDLTQSLVTAGVNPSDAPGLISKVRDGFKAGVQFAVMGARVHHSDDADEVYLYSYAKGRSAMRYTSPSWVLLRTLAPIIGIALVAFVFWKFVF